MSDPPELLKQRLDNGLDVVIRDVTRHYFGGYWQVALEVSCSIPVVAAGFENPDEEAEARRLLGDERTFCRRLEQMAVPTDQRETVRDSLLVRARRHLLPMLARSDFACQFIRSECRQQRIRAVRTTPAGRS